MNNFNYFFTPVGPEYKKKFARNVAIGLVILFSIYGVSQIVIDLQETPNQPDITLRYEKYLDENNELNFALQYDKHGLIIDDLQRILDWCDYSGAKPEHWYFDWNNSTHHIDSTNCEWIESEN